MDDTAATPASLIHLDPVPPPLPLPVLALQIQPSNPARPDRVCVRVLQHAREAAGRLV
jgi:hypothetical protein